MEMQTINSGACNPPAQVEYKQLVESPDLFMDQLRNFHASIGSNFSLPSIGETSLDLHKLFVEVTSRGGFDQVLQDRKWQEVVSALEIPAGQSFVLRTRYMSLLYNFERVYFLRRSAQTVTIAAPELTEELPEQSDVISHSSAGSELQPGLTLMGTIDEKFDSGYVVSISMGVSQLKGILYHISDDQALPSSGADPGTMQRQKMSQQMLLGPPESMPSGSIINFSSEHCATPLPLSQEQNRMWSSLSGTGNSSVRAAQ